MQANKASEDMRERLATWLQNPNGATTAISTGAKADLEWLRSSDDLSAVSIDPEKPLQKPISGLHAQSDSGGSAVKGTVGVGIWSLFGCASRRK